MFTIFKQLIININFTQSDQSCISQCWILDGFRYAGNEDLSSVCYIQDCYGQVSSNSKYIVNTYELTVRAKKCM